MEHSEESIELYEFAQWATGQGWRIVQTTTNEYESLAGKTISQTVEYMTPVGIQATVYFLNGKYSGVVNSLVIQQKE